MRKKKRKTPAAQAGAAAVPPVSAETPNGVHADIDDAATQQQAFLSSETLECDTETDIGSSSNTDSNDHVDAQQHAAHASSDAANARTTSTSSLQLAEEPSLQLQQQDASLMPHTEALKVLDRFFIVLFMANVAVHIALKPLCGCRISVGALEATLQQAGLPGSFVPTERSAFASLASTAQHRGTATSDIATDTDGIDVQLLVDRASAIAFRIELCELEIRTAVLERSNGARTVARPNTDVQRTVARLMALPSSAATTITSSEFASALTQKLGVTPSRFFTRVVFARIAGRTFARSFPQELVASRSAFTDAFERFCVHRPLSLDAVEGQLRYLLTRYPDLHATFQALDLDQSGTLSTAEFVTFLQQEASMTTVPTAVLEAFVKRFDANGDDALSYDEFVAFVRPTAAFGVHILSPFGSFYFPLDRRVLMRDVVATITTRLFWLEHNNATTSTGKTSTSTKRNGVDTFVLTHHFGTTRLQFRLDDAVGNVLTNGELVVLVADTGDASASRSTSAAATESERSLPPFEYRLKSTAKRTLPLLVSTAAMMRDGVDDAQQQKQQQQRPAPSAARRSSNTRSVVSSASAASTRSLLTARAAVGRIRPTGRKSQQMAAAVAADVETTRSLENDRSSAISANRLSDGAFSDSDPAVHAPARVDPKSDSVDVHSFATGEQVKGQQEHRSSPLEASLQYTAAQTDPPRATHSSSGSASDSSEAFEYFSDDEALPDEGDDGSEDDDDDDDDDEAPPPY